MKYSLVLLSLFLSLVTVPLTAAEPVRVSVADFGATAGDRSDCVAAVRRALEECRKHEAATLVFPKGRYDFFAPAEGDRFALPVGDFKNLTIDGGHSEFVFHGIMGVCAVRNSENVTLKNFSVDWDEPFIAQGTIVDTQPDWVDIRFDTKQYRFDIDENAKIGFHVTGWAGKPERRKVDGYTLLFNKGNRELVYRTRDNALGGNELFNEKAEDLGDGLVRFHGKPRKLESGGFPEPGTEIALWLGRYVHVAFDLNRSKDVTLENITIYHSLSHAVVGFKTENITLRRVCNMPNRGKGRVFSLVADGFHLNTCRGKVIVAECIHEGAGDDFMNLHGMNVLVEKRIDERTLQVGVSGKTGASYVLDIGDEVWFVDGKTVQRGGSGRIREIKEIRQDGKTVAKHIIFEEPIPEGVKEKDALENKTWNAELIVTGCNIGRSHRARGILVTTPCKATITDNHFATAGAAILIEGDVNYWYESGAVNDLLISGNHFEECFSSGYAGDWGHAVITIHPSFQPQNETDEPYHRNIVIRDNIFQTFDYPLVYARSVRNLEFSNNRIRRTDGFHAFAAHKETFRLDGCRDVKIADNDWEENVRGKNVKTFHMTPADLKLEDKEIRIEE